MKFSFYSSDRSADAQKSVAFKKGTFFFCVIAFGLCAALGPGLARASESRQNPEELVTDLEPDFSEADNSEFDHFGFKKVPATGKWDRLEDLKVSLGYIIRGSYLQFTEEPSWWIMGLSTAMLVPAFHNDDKIVAEAAKKEVRGVHKTAEWMSVIFNLPVVPFGIYELSKLWRDEKLKRFAMEYGAALYLALAESSLISIIPIHDRPKTTDVEPWEKHFRMKSSFPSGHVVPFMTLTFKSFQYYGPLAAIAPAFLSVMTSVERVRSEKHYFSDIVGTFLISALASEGTRIASGYENNHSWYKSIFEKGTHLSAAPIDDGLQLLFSKRF